MKIYLGILFIGLLLTGNPVISQPTATVQFIGGYSMPLGDYKGNFGELREQFTGNGNPDSNTYFMKSGINYGIFVKVPISKKSKFSIKGGVAFNVFNQSKEYTESSGSITVDLKQSLFGITLGSDYDFGDKKNKLRPFIGAEFSGTFFAGSYTEDYVDSTESFSLNAAFRLGFNAAAGIDYTLHNNIGIIIGAKYSITNIIGKSYEADTRSKYNLNDAEYTINNIKYPSRTITFLQLYGGMSFYFGR